VGVGGIRLDAILCHVMPYHKERTGNSRHKEDEGNPGVWQFHSIVLFRHDGKDGGPGE
jgi:hypothetical protein